MTSVQLMGVPGLAHDVHRPQKGDYRGVVCAFGKRRERGLQSAVAIGTSR